MPGHGFTLTPEDATAASPVTPLAGFFPDPPVTLPRLLCFES
jgi:hypothetical protein